MGGRDESTVAALRKRAVGHDLSVRATGPISGRKASEASQLLCARAAP